jgi:hypothetical protein
MNAPRRAKVFVSYSHLDEKFRGELDVQLTILKNKGYLDWWTDQKLVPGDEWEKEILEKLQESDIILLLVSAYFLASPFCWGVELAKAIERHDQGTARVVPIFVRECVPEETPIEKLHGVPRKDRPVSNWKDRHKAWKDVAKGVQKAVEEWRKRPDLVPA